MKRFAIETAAKRVESAIHGTFHTLMHPVVDDPAGAWTGEAEDA